MGKLANVIRKGSNACAEAASAACDVAVVSGITAFFLNLVAYLFSRKEDRK